MMLTKKIPDSFNQGILFGFREFLETNWPGLPKNQWDKLPHVSNQEQMRPPLGAILDRIRKNVRRDHVQPRRNWRFSQEKKIAKGNPSQEKVLEKAFAEYLDVDCWANQVPTCSGYSSGIDGKRSIDLVHRLADGEFELIELKTTRRSGPPVFAMVEILLYGLIYVLAREMLQQGVLKDDRRPLLQAQAVRLAVLAPDDYYPEDNLAAFENIIDDTLRNFDQAKALNLTLSFQFQKFPRELLAPRGANYAKEDLLRLVEKIRPCTVRAALIDG